MCRIETTSMSFLKSPGHHDFRNLSGPGIFEPNPRRRTLNDIQVEPRQMVFRRQQFCDQTPGGGAIRNGIPITLRIDSDNGLGMAGRWAVARGDEAAIGKLGMGTFGPDHLRKAGGPLRYGTGAVKDDEMKREIGVRSRRLLRQRGGCGFERIPRQ